MVLYFIFFVYGAAIGSFVLAVVCRLGVAPVYKSRSKCLSCGTTLRTADLVPILSYFFLRGKCRYCRVPYGKNAILVEFLFGLLFLGLYHAALASMAAPLALVWLLFYTLLFISLGVIGLYDLKHTYVPVTYLVLFLSLSGIMFLVRYGSEQSIAALLGPLVVSLPFLLIWAVSKGRAVGFGDVLLYVGVGAFFGIEQGLAVLLVSIWLGAIYGVAKHIQARRKKLSTKGMIIPFVPFIVISFLIVLFSDMTIFSVLSWVS